MQVQLWLDNGWAVSSRLRRCLPERAMVRHEEIGGCCGARDEMLDVLFAGDMKTKLAAVSRASCACGELEETQRKDWLKRSARNKDRNVFYPKCIL